GSQCSCGRVAAGGLPPALNECNPGASPDRILTWRVLVASTAQDRHVLHVPGSAGGAGASPTRGAAWSQSRYSGTKFVSVIAVLSTDGRVEECADPFNCAVFQAFASRPSLRNTQGRWAFALQRTLRYLKAT